MTQIEGRPARASRRLRPEGQGADLTLSGSPECRQRPDCLLGLKKYYGLKFKKFIAVDPSLRHEVLDKGQADVSIIFTTDAQLSTDKDVLLEDDKNMFPPGNVTLVVRDQAARQGRPGLRRRRSSSCRRA